MSNLDQEDRDDLADSRFAFPKERKEPIEDAAHVRNAIARFNQVKASATTSATRRGSASSPLRASSASRSRRRAGARSARIEAAAASAGRVHCLVSPAKAGVQIFIGPRPSPSSA